jgi:hypothetical protein
MSHAVLLGDSIFDNAAYVSGGPSVSEQLRALLPSDWQVTLLAIDGDVTGGVVRQLQDLPADATHLLVSCGGNDALTQIDMLSERVNSVAEALVRVTEVRESFRRDYRRLFSIPLGFATYASVS